MSAQQQVFLSYGRGDDEPFVKAVHEYLTAQGIFAWYDRVHLPSRGEAFTAEIARAIESSERMLLFIGDHAAKSEWCKREWLHALKHCIPIIPILVNHTFDTLPKDIKEVYPDDLWWDNGLELPPDQRGNAFQKIHKLLTNAPVLPLAKLANVPLKAPEYMERPQYTSAVKAALRLKDPTDPNDARSHVVGITTATGVQGIAGIGKTTLASAIAHECDVRRHFEHIIWLRLGQNKRRADAPELLRQIGEQLNPEYEHQFIDQYKDENSSRLRVQSLLADKRTLLILDDVWDKTLLEAFQFPVKYCKLMVTTRHAHLLNENMVEIDRLSDDEGMKLIAYYQNPAAPDAKALPDDCLDIVRELNGHTLAIKIIASLLKMQGIHEASAYANRVKDLQHENLFDFLEEETISDDDETKRNLSVELSFSLSYKALSDKHQKYLRALGIFAPNSTIHVQALQAVWEIDDHLLAKKAANALEAVGLLESLGDDFYSQHGLIRAYAAKLLQSAGEHETVFGHYADYVIEIAEGFNLPQEQWGQLDSYLPHVDYVGDELVRLWQEEAKHDDELTRRIGDFALKIWRYVHNRPLAIRDGDSVTLRGTKWLEAGLSVYQATNNNAHQASMLNNIGFVWQALGDVRKALDYYYQSLTLATETNTKTDEATTLSNIGSAWSFLGDHHKALDYHYRALTIHRLTGNKEKVPLTLNGIGSALSSLGNKRDALDFYYESLSIVRKINDKLGETAVLNNIGTIWDFLGNRRKALDYYYLASEVANSVGDKRGEGTVIDNIGKVWIALGEPQMALVFFDRALSLRQTIGDKQGKATTLNNIGLAWYSSNDRHKALDFYQQALFLYREVGAKGGEATTLTNIGLAWAALGELQTALDFYNQALPIQRAIGDKASEALICYNIGDVYAAEGNLDTAIQYLERCVQLDIEVGHPDLESDLQMLERLKVMRDGSTKTQQITNRLEILLALVDIYQQQGEGALRAILQQHNKTDEQIEEIVALVKSKVE